MIKITNIYNSNKYGKYIILNKEGNYANIQFINSGCIAKVRYSRALTGNVRDPIYGLNLNRLYYSDNYGPYKILEIYKGKSNTHTKAKILFTATNNTVIDTVQRVKNGNVNDKLSNIRIPIDMNMIVDNYEKEIRYTRYLNDIWYSIKKRCYNNNASNYKFYGNLGIKLSEDWMDFNIFKTDIRYLFQYNKWLRFPTLYQLDKDYLQLGIQKELRIYSKDTCIWLHKIDNINLKTIEKYKNKLYGVSKSGKNSYNVHLNVNNSYIYLGTYSDIIVAANVFNYWYEYYHNYDIIPLHNNVPYIHHSEFIKYNTNPKEMCNII